MLLWLGKFHKLLFHYANDELRHTCLPTSRCRSSIHHEFLWQRLTRHPGTHRLREQIRRLQVPDMAGSRNHHRLCRERPAQLTSGSFYHKLLFLSKRHQNRCMYSLRQFHFHEPISKMDDRLRFEIAHIFSQHAQVGLRNVETEPETEQWSWLEHMQQRLAELAECSNYRAETSRRA